MVLDVSFWKMESGNTVNWVGGTTKNDATKKSGGGERLVRERRRDNQLQAQERSCTGNQDQGGRGGGGQGGNGRADHCRRRSSVGAGGGGRHAGRKGEQVLPAVRNEVGGRREVLSQLWGQRTVETDSGFSKFKERFFRNFPANNVATGSFGFVLVYGFVWVRQWRHFIPPTVCLATGESGRISSPPSRRCTF